MVGNLPAMTQEQKWGGQEKQRSPRAKTKKKQKKHRGKYMIISPTTTS